MAGEDLPPGCACAAPPYSRQAASRARWADRAVRVMGTLGRTVAFGGGDCAARLDPGEPRRVAPAAAGDGLTQDEGTRRIAAAPGGPHSRASGVYCGLRGRMAT